MPKLRKSIYSAAVVSAFLSFANAQTAGLPNRWGQVLDPPVPADRLELVTGAAQPSQDIDQRAALIDLLTKALQHSNVRRGPYDMHSSFTSFGSSSSDGTWELQDTSPKSGAYRWSAEGPSFSVVNLYSNQILYSTQLAASVPLRLAQVRSAIFFKETPLGPYATLRSASASLEGASLTCVLVGHDGAKNLTGGRRWNEIEYCVDPTSNNLITYSPVPGYYVLFDYSKALTFHNSLLPNKFTITQGGKTVIEAQIESITDPTESADAFQPSSGMASIGVGALMTAAGNINFLVHSPGVNPSAREVVVVHGVQPPSGPMTDLEVISSTNTSLNSAALKFATEWKGGRTLPDSGQPGATRQTHEVYQTLHFLNMTQ